MTDAGPKRHHYVPRFLLRRFTDDPENENMGRLWRLGKETGAPQRASVLNEAVIGHYYSFLLDGEAGEKDVFPEKVLSVIEGHAAEFVRRLVERGGRLDDPEARKLFGLFIHLTKQRTPLTRAWLRHNDEVIANTILEMQGYADLVAESTPSREIAMMFVAAETTAEQLAGRCTWTLLRAPAGSRFIIGDTPLVLVDLSLDPELGIGYLASPTTETTLPLDPTTCLLLTPGDEPWAEREITAEEVAGINLRSYAWAQHSIYGGTQAAVADVRALAKLSRHKLARYAPRSGKLWFGEDVEGKTVWEGHSATEAGVKARVRR